MQSDSVILKYTTEYLCYFFFNLSRAYLVLGYRKYCIIPEFSNCMITFVCPWTTTGGGGGRGRHIPCSSFPATACLGQSTSLHLSLSKCSRHSTPPLSAHSVPQEHAEKTFQLRKLKFQEDFILCTGKKTYRVTAIRTRRFLTSQRRRITVPQLRQHFKILNKM